MTAPKYITDAIAALRADRVPVASRLDAIDLAIDNLSRVYGLHGSPQPLPLPLAERRTKKSKGAPLRAAGADSAAEGRRDVLLTVIGKSDVGLTLAELRQHTPKMDGKDRSNALQTLKSEGKIRRAGNSWVKAA